jgi:tRNA(fMet)-specific endonuclease VapC
MAFYMLDTDISSFMMKRSNRAVLTKLEQLNASDLCISAITKSELMFGLAVSPHPQRDKASLDEFFEYVQVLEYPGDAAQDYGQIRADLKRRGTMIGSNDLLIAAHARWLGLTLVTNNTREFGRVAGLRIENWAEP